MKEREIKYNEIVFKKVFKGYKNLEFTLQYVAKDIQSLKISEMDFIKFLFLMFLKHGFHAVMRFNSIGIKKDISVLLSTEQYEKDKKILNDIMKLEPSTFKTKQDFLTLRSDGVSMLYILFKDKKITEHISILPFLSFDKKDLISPKKDGIISSVEIEKNYKRFLEVLIKFKELMEKE